MKLSEEQAQAVLDKIRPESMWAFGRTAYINQVGDLLIVGRNFGGSLSIQKRITGSATKKLDALIGWFPQLDRLFIAAGAAA